MQQVETLAEAHGWRRLDIGAPPFVLAAWRPAGSPADAETGKLLTVYIEGDGLAWVTRSRLSSDPTPVDPVGLNLALRHPGGQVAYLARPCQFTSPENSAGCEKKYWTTHRFAPEVIAASNRAVTVLKEMSGASTLQLVGYSGGGAVALLVAAARDDVSSLVTVAGNLDHARWTARHSLDPLDGSLNPAAVASSLAPLPQLHFVGMTDRVVPAEIAAGFVAGQGPGSCAEVVPVADVDHSHGWVERWPELLNRPFPCQAARAPHR